MSGNDTIIPTSLTAISTSTILPFDTAQSLVLSFILAVLSAVPKPSSPLRHGLLFLQILVTAHAYFAPAPAGLPNNSALYTNGVLLANLTFRYLDRLYLRQPERTFHRIDPKTKVKEDAEQLKPSSKLLWSLELIAVTRGINWDWVVTGIPPAPPRRSKGAFVASQARRWVLMYAGVHAVIISSQAVLAGFPGVTDEGLRASLVEVSQAKFFLFPFIVAGWGITIYAHFGLMMLPLSIVCVGLGIGPKAWQSQEAWPPNYGSFVQAYSIRRFWGYTWHQQMRRITSVPGSLLLAHMPASLRTSKALFSRLFRRYFLVLAAFSISGLIHASGSYTVTRLNGLPLSDGGEVKYFLLQGVALMVEDLACWMLGVDDSKQQQPSLMRRTLGYAITGSWYVWSRVALKAIPIALAHGIRDDRGGLFAAVKLVQMGAEAVPGNFVKVAAGI